MIPHELIATARVPGGGELRCYRHDRDFAIRVDGVELMTSRVHGSEEAMAELAIARLPERTAPRVLIGGLGMGFTLARTLALLPPEAVVEVAELVPEIVQWNREIFGHLAGEPLRDPRAKVLGLDVKDRIAAVNGLYDMVLLDVDNGPEGLTRRGNDQLYSERGLRKLHDAMRSQAVAAVWSSRPDDRFEGRFRAAGFHVEEHRVRARRTKGPVRTIWTGVRR